MPSSVGLEPKLGPFLNGATCNPCGTDSGFNKQNFTFTKLSKFINFHSRSSEKVETCLNL